MTGIALLVRKLNYRPEASYVIKNWDSIAKRMSFLFKTYVKNAGENDIASMYSQKVQANLALLVRSISFCKFSSDETKVITPTMTRFLLEMWMDGIEDREAENDQVPVRVLADWLQIVYFARKGMILDIRSLSEACHDILVEGVGTIRMRYISEMFVHRMKKFTNVRCSSRTTSDYAFLLVCLADSDCCRDVLRKGFASLMLKILRENAIPKLIQGTADSNDGSQPLIKSIFKILQIYPKKFIGPKHIHTTLLNEGFIEMCTAILGSSAKDCPEIVMHIDRLFPIFSKSLTGLAVIESVSKAAARANPAGYYWRSGFTSTPSWRTFENRLLVQNVMRLLFSVFVERRLWLCNNVSRPLDFLIISTTELSRSYSPIVNCRRVL